MKWPDETVACPSPSCPWRWPEALPAARRACPVHGAYRKNPELVHTTETTA